MNNVTNIMDLKASGKNRSLKEIRSEWGLTLTQAACAFEVSPATLENWEADPTKWPSAVVTENAYQAYLRRHGTTTNRNLLFSRYPLSVARDLLEMRIDQMAEMMGYSVDSWRKIEASTRILPDEKMRLLEDQVREKFAIVCGFSELG